MKHSTFTDRSAFGAIRRLGFAREVALFGQCASRVDAKRAVKGRTLIPLVPVFGTCQIADVKLLSRRTLREFWERHPGSEDQLRTWASVVEAARWANPMELKATYGSADILKSGRVVFDVGGNKYRLVVAIRYANKRRAGTVFVRFIGTHAAYDEINADEV